MYKNTKLYSVLSYITWIGWLIALFLRDKDDPMVKHHLNQGLVLNIIELLASFLITRGGTVAVVGEIVDLGVLVLCIMGIVRAVKLSNKPLPIIGTVNLIN